MGDILAAEYDDRHYELDVESITPREFKVIKTALGLKAGAFIKSFSSIDEMDADAATALLWLFRKRAGVHQGTVADFDEDFPMVTFFASMSRPEEPEDPDVPKAGSPTTET